MSARERAKSGRLYGVGLGPGDPELITRRGARLIETAEVIAYPALAGGDSLARSIAAELIPAGAEEIVMDIPMTPARAPAQAAYDDGAARIAAALDTGRDVVCLCEGDPFFYGSFMYLFARLAPAYPVEVVPGVTSLTACAARAAMPLAARNEVMTVLPGPLPDDALRGHLRSADTVICMKVGRHLPRLRALLAAEGLTGRATYVERATLGTERVLPLAEAPESAPYFSMILIAKGADPWL
ncbi:precorrin-2 C(20)-methyltransferase [Jannaschia seohaensis]|uniref:Precorrin-2/cobalt-factor-2 C20-methyltransferase n=1 Tax=Jannaschia seohaensis TaxID=475081 RepID=A0A2Y9A1V7_9RHOB|nr:precorrin-2 C(20)-methyltransferase [Jannaschia seohaensis]PWJ21967.1 precorrin-2/cobalt-factor-2 C20-methyltransferase [Jannaschia seohaensis]SSA38245.1 precorrin-2/cobalt-factor-2 C20-methyltransferase [Jannaschia seohaensis]